MALVFHHSAEEPARCALEIAEALRKHPELRVRMGIHSGPVSEVTDVSGRTNIAGAGINTAQRVMDCGDSGHILLSQHVADDLMQYRQCAAGPPDRCWRDLLINPFLRAYKDDPRFIAFAQKIGVMPKAAPKP